MMEGCLKKENGGRDEDELEGKGEGKRGGRRRRGKIVSRRRRGRRRRRRRRKRRRRRRRRRSADLRMAEKSKHWQLYFLAA